MAVRYWRWCKLYAPHHTCILCFIDEWKKFWHPCVDPRGSRIGTAIPMAGHTHQMPGITSYITYQRTAAVTLQQTEEKKCVCVGLCVFDRKKERNKEKQRNKERNEERKKKKKEIYLYSTVLMFSSIFTSNQAMKIFDNPWTKPYKISFGN